MGLLGKNEYWDCPFCKADGTIHISVRNTYMCRQPERLFVLSGCNHCNKDSDEVRKKLVKDYRLKPSRIRVLEV